MHEHTFIQSIIAPIKNKEKVEGVEIELGELVGIEPDHLHEHLIEETAWKVKIKEIKSKVKCSCGYAGPAKIRERLHDLVIYNCPKCGKMPEVLEGKDVKIIKVTYK
jgi:Zn finger protein HypA/HybF involved in hydrogenase expression